MKLKDIFYYIFIVGIALTLSWALLRYGNSTHISSDIQNKTQAQAAEKENNIFTNLWENIGEPLSILILQIITILLVARFFSVLLKRIGQPTVIGEILAGILLGPSLLGWVAPDVAQFLFAESSHANLQFLSQIGLILFMFVIGLELDSNSLRGRTHKAILISHSGIVLLFTSGILLALFLYKDFSGSGTSFLAFGLFMGIALSITAFPVLARILQERGLSGQPIGSLVIACAASDDVTAWCLLAVVIAIVKAGAISGALISIGLALIYALFMFYVVKPIMTKVGNYYSNREMVGRPQVALVFIILLVSAWMTEVIGVHALFGAFIAGVIMPDGGNFKRIITEKIEDLSLILLLPLFFVFTGLRTKIGLINEPHLWAVCLVIIGVAIAGKLIGNAGAARFLGMSWRDSFSIGILMNARGLMELVILNIAYDLGVLSDEIFAMLVIMALFTTFMTGPALDLLNYVMPVSKLLPPLPSTMPKILMSFGKPEMGESILRLCYLLTERTKEKLEYTSMHISPQYDISPEEAQQFERESFAPILDVARQLNIPIRTYYRATEDITNEIVDYTDVYNPDILIVGSAQSLFDTDLLGGRISKILNQTTCDTLVFSDRGLQVVHNVLVLYYDNADKIVIEYALLLAKNQNAIIHVLNLSEEVFEELIPVGGKIIFEEMKEKIINKDLLSRFDMLIVNREKWHSLVDNNSQWIQYSPSLLIVKKGTERNKLLEENALLQPSII